MKFNTVACCKICPENQILLKSGRNNEQFRENLRTFYCFRLP